MSATKIQKLIFSSEKIHSVRYDALKSESDPVVTSIYVMKGRLLRPFPKEIELQITVKED